MKLFLVWIFIITSLATYANEGKIRIDKITLKCLEDGKCRSLNDSLRALKRSYGNLEHFNRVLKLYVSNEGVEELAYEVLSLPTGGLHLKLVASQKKVVKEIQSTRFKSHRSIDLPSILPVREDDFIDYRKVEQTERIMNEIGRDKGYPDTKSKIRVIEEKDGVIIKPTVDLGKPVTISKLNIISQSPLLKNYLQNILGGFEKQVLDLQEIKTQLERAREAFIQYGYYLSDIDLRVKNIGRYKALVFVEVKYPDFYTFYFENAAGFDVGVLKQHLTGTMLSYKRELSEESLEQILTEYAEERGFGNIKVDVSKVERKSSAGEEGVYYNIKFTVGEKIKISDVSFKGNSHFSDSDLKKLFYENSSDQVGAGIHDEKYYATFLSILRNKYITNGYVSVFLDEPIVNSDRTNNSVSVTYRLREGPQALIDDININGVNSDEATSIRKFMVNKYDRAFNPIAFEQDLENINIYLQSLGYYFATITNVNGEGIVKYSSNLSNVSLNILVSKKEKLYLNKVIMIGNKATKKKLILRELNIEEGELITNKKIERAQTALLGLGIFNQVQIQPVRGGVGQTDILVFVRERDFGSIEVAPGIRSDLGLKLSTVVNYNNLDGMNKRITFRGSVNRRLNLNSIDESRRDDQNDFTEYDLTLDFAENHVFGSELDFRSSLGYSRQRFFSFDADIRRFGLGLSSQINSWLSWQTRYQLEAVSQYNTAPVETGEEDINHGQFKIGSVTPGIVMDFRDRAIGTRKGAVIDLSVEFANPAFGSEEQDPKVDYYKFINRNKFYYPVSDRIVLAVSTAFGYQENLADKETGDGELEGYIPGLKVFRLSGADIIRGYEDDEMNRIEQTNDDISKYEVNSRAYMASLKFEPRYYYSDNIIIGTFYDAGRIFVNEFESDKLRSSVGLSFKYLTPVGTLDVDYGIKLLRKRDSDGTLDSPGRLHVSIGFF